MKNRIKGLLFGSNLKRLLRIHNLKNKLFNTFNLLQLEINTAIKEIEDKENIKIKEQDENKEDMDYFSGEKINRD